MVTMTTMTTTASRAPTATRTFEDSAPVGECVLAVDAERRITTITAMAASIFGYYERSSIDEFLSRNQFFSSNERTPLSVRDPLFGVLGQGGARSRELFVRTPSRPDGVHLRVTATPDSHSSGAGVIACEPVEVPFDTRRWRVVACVADVVARSHSYSTIVASVHATLRADVAFDGVALFTVERGQLAVVAVAGEATPSIGFRLDLDDDTAARLRLSPGCHQNGDRVAGDCPLCERLGLGAVLTVPLFSGGDFVGLLAVTRRRATRFSSREVSLFGLVAPHLAHAVSHVRVDLLRERWSQLLVHDLKSPLAALMLNLDTLNAVDEGERADALRDCQRSVKTLLGITADLRDMFRCEEVGVPLRRRPLELAALVERVIAPLRDTIARGTPLVAEVSPEIVLSADPDLLARVIDNTVSNAIRYTPAGGAVRIDASLVDGDVVLVGIENDGPPIDPALAEELFSKYCEAGDRHARRRGLGLYLCRLFIEAHGGTIRLAPSANRTTRFEIRLPRAV
jgi:signal transduction histidine kinase